ncbi:MAG: BppU family phage baseplate upper protein, partial [Clostridia bacterium]|nr:BppU family phage baseplate upper protein [Clostridia bacterium]
MEIRHNIVLDASRPNMQCSLMMSTGDVSSHRVVIALRNRGEPVSLENVSGYVYFSKPDSTEVVQSAAVYWDNGTNAGVMTLVVNQQVLTAVGRVTCRAVLCGAEGEELYSPIFMIDVVSNPALDAAITSQSEYAALTDAKLEAQAWAEGKKGTVDVIDGQDQYHNNARWYAEQAAALGEAIAQMLEECETWEDGKSAYEIAVENGFEGTEIEWLASLVGAAGQNGTNGQNGEDGQDGKSAYELAVENGFEGTEVEWLASLVGAAGQNGSAGAAGKSAYAAAVEAGYSGTEAQFNADLS